MTAYYNEHDAKAAAWLRELIRCNLIAPGEVDERSVVDVCPSDIAGFTQCHFFAGIGVWSYALRLAGWPDDQPVWTGSCPCQPFSIANVADGGGLGTSDERHLLPVFTDLIVERSPDVVFGEQVANAVGKGWLDDLYAPMERADYACGSLVLPANAFGADHERKRVLWVAHARGARWPGHQPVKCFPESARTPLSVSRDNFLRARRVMAHDYDALLPCDGASVVLERDALKGFGNAIVAPVAQAFIEAYLYRELT